MSAAGGQVPLVQPDAPIRSELFGAARFEQHGRSLAAVHAVQPIGVYQAEPFFPRLRDNVRVLHRSCHELDLRARAGLYLGPAGNWLLDNMQLVDEQLHTIRDALPRSFFRRLPRLADRPQAGLPRIYSVAWAYVAHADSRLDEDLLGAYLVAYQRVRALTLAELWALPTTLRVVLVENLRRLADRVMALQAARDAAHQWFDGPEAQRTIDSLSRLQHQHATQGAAEAFFLQLEQREDELPLESGRELAAWLLPRLGTEAEAEARQQAQATEDLQSIRNTITSLRRLERIDWRALFERSCEALQVMAACPVHAAENNASQDRTLRALQRLARESAQPEADVARLLRDLTQRATDAADPRGAPGWWWAGEGEALLRQALNLPPRRWPRQGSAALRRLATVTLLPGMLLASVGGTGWLLDHAGAPGLSPGLWLLTALLLLLPASEAVVAVVNRLISESLPPLVLPQLALAEGLTPAQRTLLVMPSQLNHEAGITALVAQLEQHHLANPERQLQLALLTDWVDAEQATSAGDEALLALAHDALQALNARYPQAEGVPRFLLLHRARQWSATQQRHIGWERKRGKLEQLIEWLSDGEGGETAHRAPDPAAAQAAAGRADGADAANAAVATDATSATDVGIAADAATRSDPTGRPPSPFVDLGPLSRPAAGIRYLVTLDSDTSLPPGALRALVAVAAHPLNRPQLDAARRRVVAGHGVLQPRVVTPLPTEATDTGFHWLFAGRTGVDPYSAASSEVYQDLFAEGTYTGKGLIDVAAARQVLVGRLPAEQVLSHDLIEGIYARCAAVSDVTLVEDAPLHADVAASRLHRWTRGDWQLLPLLRPAARAGVPMINRWKMVDNLRRSLVAPLSVLLLLWVLVSGALPAGWVLAVVAMAYGAGPLLGALAALTPSRDDIALAPFFRAGLADLGRALLTPLWHIATLLAQALMYGDAIVRALHRQYVSRRGLLEWQTAADAQAAARHSLPGLLRQHRRVPATAAALALLAGAAWLAGAPVALPLLLPLLALWAAAPLWIWLASRPYAHRLPQQLTAADRDYLHDLARDSWRFYERHVGAEDNHLPPDNLQLQPQAIVAHRTSPTNIGLYLLAVASAARLGFIGRVDMAERIAATLDTLDRLPRHRGHFYNWIDTRSLALLAPAYISAVDSGNCSASLLVLARACEQAAAAPPASMAAALARSAQRVQPLRAALAASPALHALAGMAALPGLTGGADDITIDLVGADGDIGTKAETGRPADGAKDVADGATAHATASLDEQLQAARRELDALALSRGDTDESPALWLLRDHLATVASAVRDQRAADPAPALRQLAARARQLALAADYRCLYDRRRRLLHIGLRVDSGELDDNHYDLLASEARLTSLVAIAKGDLPAEHWAALGRPYFARGSHAGLKSWAGSMFEYLMPSLLLDEPLGSVLAEAGRSAVQVQRDEARAQGTPWGISESAIAVQDHTLAYQYGPQGVARLALRRAPPDERVLAPYATAMALLVEPAAAVANLRALQALGARQPLGFIEALDYTPQRQSGGTSGPVLVHTVMAHHQAMSLLAYTEALAPGLPGSGSPRRWAMAEPHLRAVAQLLHERPPRELPRLVEPPALAPLNGTSRAQLALDVPAEGTRLPATLLLGNGSQAAWLRGDGGGVSRWQGIALTRWRDDLLRNAHGSWLYLERIQPGAAAPRRHSLTPSPAPDPQARYQARLQPDRAVFDTRWPHVHARSTIWISPEDDCELRQVELENRSGEALTLVLSLAAEVTLAEPAAEAAHPAFANLFVKAHWDDSDHALYLRRQPRLVDEAAMLAVYFVAAIEGDALEVEPCVDRARWLGRHGSSAGPVGDGGADRVSAADGALAAAPAGAPASSAAGAAAAHAEADPGALPGMALDTGLDPMAVLQVRLQLLPGARARVVFACAAGRDLGALAALVDRYQQAAHVQRASSMAHTSAASRLRDLQVDADGWRALQWLQTLLAWSAPREPAQAQRRNGGGCERAQLWPHGISGERPLLLVQIADEAGLPLLQLLKKALRGWSAAGLGVDLVIINAEPASYLMPVQRQLQQLLERHWLQQDERWPENQRSRMHLLRSAELSDTQAAALHALARVRLLADGRSLAQQMDRLLDELQADARRLAATPQLPVRELPPLRAGGPAPRGRFAPDGGFSFRIEPGRRPQRPWINVLANPDFGCHVSETGAGMSWALNSRQHQITPWSNDPLCDPAGEWLLLHDLDRAQVWPLAASEQAEVEHAPGLTRIRQTVADLAVELVWTVDSERALKQVQLTVMNNGAGPRRLRLVAVAEWQLGASRMAASSVFTRCEPMVIGAQGEGLPSAQPCPVLLATQLDPGPGLGRQATAFLAWRREAADGDAAAHPDRGVDVNDWTCDRRELFDALGRRRLPMQLARAAGLGLDPCAATACRLTLAAGVPGQATLLLGHAPTPDDARRLARNALEADPAERLQRQRAQWAGLASALQVQSPDPLFDALVNHWLPYQTQACRLWARAGFYQAGGAYGFRDQLQDAMGLIWHAPAGLAAQIRLHAGRQFAEGDVQHWWHPPEGAGVRTHFSDDLLWLPYALAQHVAHGGDAALLDEPQTFLQGQAVPADREDIYEIPRPGHESASLYEHGARAIDRSLRTGRHGLPLMGTGDWNDGMNRVGHQGQGESVWLAWFLCEVVRGYLPLAQARGEQARVDAWTTARQGWCQALDAQGWDGRWYRRAFFDDGTPLGSDASRECRIDLIAQAWAVLSAAGDPQRARQAMHSVHEQLYDARHRLLPLLAPPLQHARPSAGYIQSYPPGVRENGGQYNHAVAWAALAFAQLGEGGAAWQAWQAVSPAHRWADEAHGERYALEPYVVAGDVYACPPWEGRGGWSWYSGSAGWLLRAAIEGLAGLQRSGGQACVRPCLPPGWPQLNLHWRLGERRITLLLCADAALAGAALRQHAGARALAPGATFDLNGLRDGEVLVVNAGDVPPAAAPASVTTAVSVAPAAPATPAP